MQISRCIAAGVNKYCLKVWYMGLDALQWVIKVGSPSCYGDKGGATLWTTQRVTVLPFKYIIYEIYIINAYQNYVLKVLLGWIRKISGIHGLQLIFRLF